jgi:ABC-type transport system involved in multi-copper enzyme maturation permease subunit
MVTTGAIGAFLWDALIFDRRDAMVLLPMPVRRRTIVAAKLAALAVFIAGAAFAVNLLNAIMFALATADLDSARCSSSCSSARSSA